MDEMKRRYLVNRENEQKAKSAMSVVVFAVIGLVLLCAIASPFLLTYVCQVRGC